MSRFDWTKVSHNSRESVGDSEPALGPRILFFSGGSAIRDISSCLACSTRRSVHVITTFDSGGSSAALRSSLNLPAVGDLRSRISALADTTRIGMHEALELWEYRLDRSAPSKRLHETLSSLCSGTHPYIRKISVELARAIQPLLADFEAAMPSWFDLRGACIGNLILAGGCLRFGSIGESVRYCSEAFGARGIISPVSEEPAHLAVRYRSGRMSVGQHSFSSKSAEAAKVGQDGGIEDMWLTSGLESGAPLVVNASEDTLRHIRCADMICYPPGSFYSSLVANLLPQGVGRAVADNPCPKVFMPNPGADAELAGHDLRRQVEVLVDALAADAPGIAVADVLHAVLVDTSNGKYGAIPRNWLAGQGIAVLDLKFAKRESTEGSFVKADPVRACDILLGIAEALGR